MVHVERVKLPGIGLLHKFVTDQGYKLGVVRHRPGDNDLVVHRLDDDADAKVVLRLSDDEAHTLADLLGGTTVSEGITALQNLPGLSIDWLQVGYQSACAGATLGHPKVAGGDGVSVVAVIRGDQTIPSPDPTFRVFPGDTVVAVGRPETVAELFKVLEGGESQTEGAVSGATEPTDG